MGIQGLFACGGTFVPAVSAPVATRSSRDPRSEMDCHAERTDLFAFLDRRPAAVLAVLEAG